MQTGHAPTSEAATGRWTDSFLDELRQTGDPDADQAIDTLLKENAGEGIRTLFGRMDANDEVSPAVHFPALAGFFRQTDRLPADIDLDRLHHGEDVFEAHAFTAALVLLTKSLPEGYQAPNLSVILNISGDLRTHTYRRLLGTLQTVINVSTCRGFQQGGRAIITAQKLQLLHAGVRNLTRRYRPDYEARYGVPVNQEDMLGTVLGFSFLVIEGWRALGDNLSPREEEDFLYLWLTFARLMGIHPPGQPESAAWIPDSIADATAFYRAYERRHYVAGEDNPDGVALAASNLSMLEKLIPGALRLCGFGLLPRLYMKKMMGEEACGRLQLPPAPGHSVLLFILHQFHRLLTLFSSRYPLGHERLAMVIFQALIDRSFDGRITYTIPEDMMQMRSMVDQKNQPRVWRQPHA